MKSNRILILISFIALSGVFFSCKKSGINPNAPLQITALDTGKTIDVTKGQTFDLTLGNPGDGGYAFDIPLYNSSLLTLVKHTHTPPPNSDRVGDFGTDTWEFSATSTGSTALKITATRGGTTSSTITMFNGSIAIVN
jgi:predicted secreted protein